MTLEQLIERGLKDEIPPPIPNRKYRKRRWAEIS
jgi:hypothetical protein